MAGKRTQGHHNRVLRRALVFEKALHSWHRWLYSIANGRKVLRLRQAHPSLEEMMGIAKKAITEMEFPSCTLLEVYWLCCVFADYETTSGFKFDKLVLPDWFPSHFRKDAFWTFDFKGKRVYPPEIWDEADRRFWFERDPVIYNLPPEKRAEMYENYPYSPERDYILVLPIDHPARKYIKRGRPITDMADGETLLG